MTSITVVSKSRVEELGLIWLIPHFDDIQKNTSILEKVQCQFEMGSTFGRPRKWKASLVVSNRNEEKWIGVVVELAEKPRELTELYGGLSVLRVIDRNGNVYKEFYTNEYLNIADGDSGWLEVFQQEEDLGNLVEENGTLTLALRVVMLNHEPEPEKVMMSKAEFEAKFLNKLSEDMSEYLEHLNMGHKDSTTKIVSKDGKMFTVNQGIIQVRCPVFHAFLQGSARENSASVTIPDLNSKALSILIQFLHTGVLNDNWVEDNVFEEVLYGAKKFELTDLLDYLELNLIALCTVQNCGRLLKLAELMGLKWAQGEIMYFCRDNFRKMTTEEATRFLAETSADIAGLEDDEGIATRLAESEEPAPARKKIKLSEALSGIKNLIGFGDKGGS